MKLQNLLSAVAVVFALSATASAQESAFKAGQAVYVVVMTSSGQPDLSTEHELKDEFAKQKAFKVAPSLQSADFVFLMLVEYEYNQVAVGAIAVGSGDIKSVAALGGQPDSYTQYKADLDNRREEELGRTSDNTSNW